MLCLLFSKPVVNQLQQREVNSFGQDFKRLTPVKNKRSKNRFFRRILGFF